MSIEQAIAAHTEALIQNTSAVLALREAFISMQSEVDTATSQMLQAVSGLPTEQAQPEVASNTGSRKRKTAKAASSPSDDSHASETAPASTVLETAPAETAVTVEPVAENVTQEQIDPLADMPADPAKEPPTYKETSDAVVNLANAKGRAAALAILEKFGVAKLPEAKPEQYADIIAACAEALL